MRPPIKTARPRDYVEGTVMTGDQMERWMMAMTREERRNLIEAMMNQASYGNECFTMDHLGRIETLERQLQETLVANAKLKERGLRL